MKMSALAITTTVEGGGGLGKMDHYHALSHRICWCDIFLYLSGKRKAVNFIRMFCLGDKRFINGTRRRSILPQLPRSAETFLAENLPRDVIDGYTKLYIIIIITIFIGQAQLYKYMIIDIIQSSLMYSVYSTN